MRRPTFNPPVPTIEELWLCRWRHVAPRTGHPILSIRSTTIDDLRCERDLSKHERGDNRGVKEDRQRLQLNFLTSRQRNPGTHARGMTILEWIAELLTAPSAGKPCWGRPPIWDVIVEH